MTWRVALLDSGAHYSDTEAPYIYGTGAVRSNAHLRTDDPYGIKLTANAQYTLPSQIAASLSGFTLGAAVWLSALPASNAALMGGTYRITTSTDYFWLRLNTDGSLSIMLDDAVLDTTAAGVIVAEQHRYIELCGYQSSLGLGGARLAIDGQTVLNVTIAVSGNAATIWFNAPAGVDVYLSGVYLLRGAIGDSAKLLGPIWVKALAPTADGHYTDLTPSTGTDHYALVDEQPPNTADYLSLAVDTWTKDSFTVAALGETEAVKAVGAMAYACSQTQNEFAGDARLLARQSGADYESDAVATSRSNRYISYGWLNAPGTGLDWDAATIAAVEFGAAVTGDIVNEMRVSQFVVLVALAVDTTPAAPDPGVARLKVAQQLLEIAIPYAGDDELPDITEWLLEDRERCLLFEIEWLDTSSSPDVIQTEYLSNIGYTTYPGDTPADTNYPDLVISMPSLTMRLDEMTRIGELVILNQPETITGLGDFDLWHRRPLVGQEVRCYLGDRSWRRSLFRLFFRGITEAISYDAEGNLVLTIADRSSLLEKVTKYQTIYGRVFNIEPHWIGPGDPIYKIDQFPSCAVFSVSDVRDNGVSLGGSPPGYTLSDSNREITLDASPAGRVTVDADKSEDITAGAVIEQVVQDAGLTTADLETESLVEAALTVGYYVAQDQEDSYLDIVRQMANAAGGYIHCDYAGLLRYYTLDLGSDPLITLTVDDVANRKVSISEVREPASTFKLGYRRNWSVQDADALAGSVTDENRQLYSTEYRYAEVSNTLSPADAYPKSEDITLNTLLADGTEAAAEASRRAALLESRGYTLEFTLPYLAVFLRLGDVVTLDYPRYGLSGGKAAAVIGLSVYPDRDETDITLWTQDLGA